MSHKPPTLPQDLIDSITEHLAGDDHTLHALSLVSWAFVFPTRRHIFRHLSIYFFPGIDEKLSILSSLPSSHLSLARSLYIYELDTMFTFDHRLLLHTLKLLVNLDQVKIRCYWDKGLDIVDQSGICRVEIIHELCRPTITHMTLTGSFVFPPRDLHRCTALTHLSLRNVSFLANEVDSTPPPRIPIKSLFLGPYNLLPQEYTSSLLATQYLQHPSCPLDLHQLESLAFRAVDLYEHVEFLRFMTVLPLSCITSFVIEVPISEIGFGDDQLVDLSIMPHLSCLTLVGVDLRGEYQFISWAIAQLRKIPRNNKLRELHLWYCFDPDDVWIDRTRDWDALDDHLADERFKGLKQVYIRMDVEYVRSDISTVSFVNSVLRKTGEQKCLNVSISDFILLDADFPAVNC